MKTIDFERMGFSFPAADELYAIHGGNRPLSYGLGYALGYLVATTIKTLGKIADGMMSGLVSQYI